LRRNPQISRILDDFGQFCPDLAEKRPRIYLCSRGYPQRTRGILGGLAGRPENPTPANAFDGVPQWTRGILGPFWAGPKTRHPLTRSTGYPHWTRGILGPFLAGPKIRRPLTRSRGYPPWENGIPKNPPKKKHVFRF
jgi:hypothetical protein